MHLFLPHPSTVPSQRHGEARPDFASWTWSGLLGHLLGQLCIRPPSTLPSSLPGVALWSPTPSVCYSSGHLAYAQSRPGLALCSAQESQGQWALLADTSLHQGLVSCRLTSSASPLLFRPPPLILWDILRPALHAQRNLIPPDHKDSPRTRHTVVSLAIRPPGTLPPAFGSSQQLNPSPLHP